MPFLYGGGDFPLVRTALLSTLSSGCSYAAPATPGLLSPKISPKNRKFGEKRYKFGEKMT